MGIEKRAAFAKREAGTPGRASYCTARESDLSECGKFLKNRKKTHFFKWGGADGTRHCLVVAPEDSNNTDPPTSA